MITTSGRSARTAATSESPSLTRTTVAVLGGFVIYGTWVAFSNRDYLLWLNFAMSWDDPANDQDYIDRTRRIVGDLKPWTGRGIYVNMLNFDEMDRVVEAFRRVAGDEAAGPDPGLRRTT